MRPFVAGVLLVLALGCKRDEASIAPAPKTHAASALDAGRPTTLVFLITGAENGYLLPTPAESTTDAGVSVNVGGAAELQGRWVRAGHCDEPLTPDGTSPCPNDGTIALSTGDNANGHAISSYFKGEPTAEVMRQMGYAASALGNRELDWAKEIFVSNTARGGFPYLAANLKATSEDARSLGLRASRVITRRGIKVGIIGLAAKKATVTPMAGRMAGLDFLPDEEALAAAVPAVRAEGASVVGVVSDGCLNDAAALVTAHPEWKLAFFAGRYCDEPFPTQVGMTELVYPGRHFNTWAQVMVSVDSTKAVVKVEASSFEVTSKDAAPPNEKVLATVKAWKSKLDVPLGERIGATKGIEQDSALMSAWLTTALKERFATDVALLNRKGVRQGLPAGPITKADVYSLLPFENQVVVVRVSGEALLKTLENVEARVAGVRPRGEGFVDSAGAAIDPKRTYSVATVDYLYRGGDGFALHNADLAPTWTKVSWQTALIEWTKGKQSDEKKPLETMLKVK